MIAQAVERVWSGESSGTPGQDYAVAPLLLPSHPSQYCFPEARQIKIKLNSSTESDTSGNACGALGVSCFVYIYMLCKLVAKYLCIYLFFTVGQQPTRQKIIPQKVLGQQPTQQKIIPQKVTTTSTKKAPVVCRPTSHRYPVASNGKLLEVAVIGERTQSTQKPQSDSDVEILGVTKPTKQTQHKGKVRRNDRGLIECPKCSSMHANDPRWVYCPKCFVVIHKTCLLISGCICNYRVTR